MFYTMKSIVLLVAASLMLVAATIVVAIPNTVEADWCGPTAPCFNGRGQCIQEWSKELCVRTPNK